MSDVTMAEVRAFYPALASVAEATMQNQLDHENARWLDGPAFVRWLEREEGVDLSKVSETHKRRLRYLRGGERINLGCADELLLALGLQLSFVPDYVWAHPPTRAYVPAVSAQEKYQIIEEFRSGVPVSDLVERYAVSDSIIHSWIRKASKRGFPSTDAA